MPFSSPFFIFFFLPILLSLYYLTSKNLKNSLLLLASIIFYTWGEGIFIFLLLILVFFNYITGIMIESSFKSSLKSKLSKKSLFIFKNIFTQITKSFKNNVYIREFISSKILKRLKNSTLIIKTDNLYQSLDIYSKDLVNKVKSKIFPIAIIVNLIFLFYFKYSLFFVNSLISLLNLSRSFQITSTSIYLPLAISFFVFHAISYNIDIYNKKVRAQRNFFDLALYFLFFPHLLAGPIIRYSNIVKQLTNRIYNSDNFAYGVRRFIIGLGKKVIIADTLSGTVDEIFAIPVNHLTTGEIWLGIISFTIQIYFDFSGYSDMAIGLASLFGFKFPENFNYPYISSSIREFWTRWHITLSNWFRDYLYIPLGGSRCSPLRNFVNLWIVFLLVGLWHGANWNFVVWGLIQGTLLVIERVNNGRLIFWKPINHIYTMLSVMIGWVFFRSNSLSYGIEYLGRMFGIIGNKNISGYHPLSYFLSNDILLCIALGIIFSMPIVSWFNLLIAGLQRRINHRLSIVIEIVKNSLKFIFLIVILFFSIIIVAIQTYSPFLYFRF